MSTLKSRDKDVFSPRRPPDLEHSVAQPAANIQLNEKVKATFQIPRVDLETLQGFANVDATSVTEALRRAIRTEAMLRRQFEEGFRIVLVSEDGKTQREIVRW